MLTQNAYKYQLSHYICRLSKMIFKYYLKHNELQNSDDWENKYLTTFHWNIIFLIKIIALLIKSAILHLENLIPTCNIFYFIF